MKLIKILDSGEIIVNTPNPYTVSSYKNDGIDKITEVAHDLNDSCQFLYDCLKVLGISKRKAKDNDYTLNIDTGDKLIRLAATRKMSMEMYRVIKNHAW